MSLHCPNMGHSFNVILQITNSTLERQCFWNISCSFLLHLCPSEHLYLKSSPLTLYILQFPIQLPSLLDGSLCWHLFYCIILIKLVFYNSQIIYFLVLFFQPILFYFIFLWLHLWQMEIPRPGIESELQLQPTPQLWQCWIL